MSLKPPALDPADLELLRKSGYPEPFRSRMGDRAKRRLADAVGLTQFGVNLVTLGPGAQSALRHWHSHEDEFVYVLAGEVTLITEGGEQVLRAGHCAGYRAGAQDAHHFINRSEQPVQYLEVGSRVDADLAVYPDDDLQWIPSGSGEPGDFVTAHKDGTRY